jgi:hypothetical protein
MRFLTFVFFCPTCRYRQTVPMALAGSKIACPGCKQVVVLPLPETIREETPDWNQKSGEEPPA